MKNEEMEKDLIFFFFFFKCKTWNVLTCLL